MAMAVLATVRGIPQLYYGSEIGMSNKEKGDAAIRLDFPGGWKTDPNNAFQPESRSQTQKEYLILQPNYFSGKKTTAVHYKMTHYIPENNVYTYLDTMMTIQ
jgi:glycosidase